MAIERERCSRRGCRKTVLYQVQLMAIAGTDLTPPATLQRWKLCAEDRDLVQSAINDAVEEVTKK